MKVVVFGAGFVGRAIVAELVARGHDVTAASRQINAGQVPDGVAIAVGSAHDQSFVEKLTLDASAVVSALPAIDDGGGLAAAETVLLPAVEAAGARLGVVGGSAILPFTEGGPRQADTPGFPEWLLPRVDAHQQAVDVLTAAPEGVDWFYLAPAGTFGPHSPGTRTGSYRRSATTLVSDAEGKSSIGVEDYAIAFADELEHPRTHRGVFTVGY
jgi:putative NADH-flavin reductase